MKRVVVLDYDGAWVKTFEELRSSLWSALSDIAISVEHVGSTAVPDLGVPQREAFRAPNETPRHHLYLCPPASPALANHITIRDHLRHGFSEDALA